MWVKHINAKGGLNGHQVKFITYEDGGDSARHRAQVQDAVERQHALAFLSNVNVITGEGSRDYIEAKRVPLIGIDGGVDWAYSSPMYFPQQSSGDELNKTIVPGIAAQMLPLGKKKLGSIVCVEAKICESADTIIAKMAGPAGLELVYRGKSSVAQPDYTAECLAARNAGAEILFLLFEQNSVRRLSSACARQGYTPRYAIIFQGIDDAMAKEPNLDGAITQSALFPYFQSGTPATDEFQQARRTYSLTGTADGPGLPIGWSAGKLLEKAAVNLSEPPTTAALLAGLWSIRNDDLGGLTYPLTFIENQPPARRACRFDLVIKKGSWVSPDGYKRHCT